MGDADEARIARIVHVLGIAALVGLTAPVIHNLQAGRLASVAALVLYSILITFFLRQNHRGQPRLAAKFFALSSVALITSLQLTSHAGVHDVSVLIYPVVIVLSGALLDHKWLITVSLTAMVTLAGLYGLELGGWVKYPISQFTRVGQLVDAEAILAITSLSVGLLMKSLRDSADGSRLALASLRESESLYRTLFESVNEAIFLHDPEDGAIVDVNRRACDLFGYTPLEMRSLSVAEISAVNDECANANALHYIQAAARGEPQLFEWLARDKAGRVFWVEVNTRAAIVAGDLRIFASLRDIDERKRAASEHRRLEDQLRQSQKLESIGRLAGGVAHDFNNLLTCISVNVDLGLLEVSEDQPLSLSLREIRDATDRATVLTQRLLAFSRKQPIEPKVLDIAALFDSLHPMLQRLLDETIVVQHNAAPGTLPIHADPSQVEQILVNLAVNAKDAMPDGGNIWIEASNVTLNEEFCASHSSLRPGLYVCIAVRDTGVGIPREILSNIFEPFFTTKPVGKGTGLGLSMVVGAVEQNGGCVDVQTTQGRGTRFSIYFPAWTGDTETATCMQAPTGAPKGTERLLVVEDDVAVRNTSVRILSRLGYEVVACSDATEALRLVTRDGREFDLLITDFILPGMNGRELATRLFEKLPRLKVLLCSGYTADMVSHQSAIDLGLAFLAKPYSADQFAIKVRRVLDS